MLITTITTLPGTLVPGREFPHGCSSGGHCLSAAARGTAAAGQMIGSCSLRSMVAMVRTGNNREILPKWPTDSGS